MRKAVSYRVLHLGKMAGSTSSKLGGMKFYVYGTLHLSCMYSQVDLVLFRICHWENIGDMRTVQNLGELTTYPS